MAWLGGLILVVGFLAFLRLFGLVEKSQRVMGIAGAAMAVVRNPALSDRDKETAMQAHARQLFGLFGWLSLGGGLAVLVPLGVVWLLERVGLMSLTAVIDTTLSPLFIIVTVVLSCGYFWWARRG